MEQKKMAEAQKGIRKYERRIKELSYQVRQHQAQLWPNRTGPSSRCASGAVPSSGDGQVRAGLLPVPAPTPCSVSFCPFPSASWAGGWDTRGGTKGQSLCPRGWVGGAGWWGRLVLSVCEQRTLLGLLDKGVGQPDPDGGVCWGPANGAAALAG